jgi:hypothetical protein
MNVARETDDDDNTRDYDGSNAPQTRELTARERDIITRVLSDIIQHVHRQLRELRVQPPAVLPLDALNFDQVSIRVGEIDFIDRLIEVRSVIDPRREC